MLNSSTYPLERNHYFYGKLLTVRDFEAEQIYFNNKRRLLNRLLFGTGVVTGLRVVAIDEKSISVESGIALDDFGREIIIPSNVTLKLSMVEGFSNNDYAKNVYLCLAYDERGKEPIFSASGNAGRGGEVSEFNRIFESYRLFIREERPDPNSFTFERLFTQSELIYHDEFVSVTHTTPRYANPGDWVQAEIRIEKTAQAPRVQLTYTPELVQGTVDPQASKVQFEESLTQQESQHVLTYRFKVGQEAGQKCKLGLHRDNFKLMLGDRQLLLGQTTPISIQIIAEPIQERLLQEYYDRPLDHSLMGSSTSAIYLAKLELMQVGSTYMIEKVEQVPFEEYVYSNAVLGKLGRTGGAGHSQNTSFRTKTKLEKIEGEKDPYFEAKYNQSQQTFEYRVGIPTSVGAKSTVHSGVVELNKHHEGKESGFTFFKSSKSFVSDEIEHGLGAGNVLITLAIEEPSQKTRILQGDIDVFRGGEFEANHDVEALGAMLDPESGTFRIGVKTNSSRGLGAIRIRWWAQKSQEFVPTVTY